MIYSRLKPRLWFLLCNTCCVALAQNGGVPSFGSVEVPSLGRPTAVPAKDTQRQPVSSAPPLAAPPNRSCKPGPTLEPREYTQPELLGRPPGARARLCFYRQPSAGAVDMLQFYPSGHFVLTTQNGSGGFGISGAVLGTTRGTYGFSENTLSLRTGYAGTAVTQSGRSAAGESGLATAGQSRLRQELVLPNCQTITVAEQTKRITLPTASGHPGFLILDGERWEHMSIDCPTWQGWLRP